MIRIRPTLPSHKRTNLYCSAHLAEEVNSYLQLIGVYSKMELSPNIKTFF